MKHFTVIDAPQRSEPWYAARAGKLTGSVASEMLARLKGGAEGAGRRNLRLRLVLERITGKPQENGFQSAAMLQGIEREAAARAAYECLTQSIVTETGFVLHNEHQAGASLDGHVGDFEGLIELKSPLPATHLDYLRTGKVPGDYLKQVTHGLWVTGAQWCDWMSYQPDFPERLQTKLVRVNRADVDIYGYEREALAFLDEVAAEVEAIRGLHA